MIKYISHLNNSYNDMNNKKRCTNYIETLRVVVKPISNIISSFKNNKKTLCYM